MVGMVGWLAGLLVGWLVGWWVGWLVGCFILFGPGCHVGKQFRDFCWPIHGLYTDGIANVQVVVFLLLSVNQVKRYQ